MSLYTGYLIDKVRTRNEALALQDGSIEEFTAQGEVGFILFRREAIDRGNFITWIVMMIFNYLGFPTSAYYHLQGDYNDEEGINAIVGDLKDKLEYRRDRWDVCKIPRNQNLSTKRQRPKYFYSIFADSKIEVDISCKVVLDKKDWQLLMDKIKILSEIK